MQTRNTDVRYAIRIAKVTQWLVAEKMGISEATFTRKLRQELPDTEKQRIFKIIKDCQKEQVAIH